MEISRARQEKQVEAIQNQFNAAILSFGEHFDDLSRLEYELQNIVKALCYIILDFRFDDDLLLKLFERLEYTLNYLEKIKAISAPYQLSA